MQRKVLLAVDGSKRCNEVISQVGRILKGSPGSGVVLFHCVQRLGVPHTAGLYELAHTYSLPVERQEKMGKAVLEESVKVLVEAGFPEGAIQTALKVDSDDPARDILDEARKSGMYAVVVGRRGLSRTEGVLVGGVSNRLAEYGGPLPIWIVDNPLNQSGKVLIAVQGIPGGGMLANYVSEVVSLVPYSHFTFLHLMPLMPPTYWDDGHILNPEERKAREGQIEDWRRQYKRPFESLMAEARDVLASRGISPEGVETRIEPVKEGIARDLLGEIARERYEMVIMGKKSLQKKTPFLLGSVANKILTNAKGVALCLVGST
jgi:nucleotide-binding universal stress UspA family protein